MRNPKILAVVIGAIYVIFLHFLYSNNIPYAQNTSALIIPLIALAYFCHVDKKSVFFTLFLILYSLSELLGFFYHIMPESLDYIVGNGLYVLAFVALTIEISRNLSLIHIIKKYWFSIIILILLNCYITYILIEVVYPEFYLEFEYFLELIYDISMLMVLSFALLKYLNSGSEKAFYFLVGAICIVFSDVLNVAYLYVSKQKVFSVLIVSLDLIGFYFFYAQAKLRYRKKKEVMF